jgi:hypothetical protein
MQSTKLGKIVDSIPTSTIEVLPPGSTPKESTFTPNPDSTEPVSVAEAESESTAGEGCWEEWKDEGNGGVSEALSGDAGID